VTNDTKATWLVGKAVTTGEAAGQVLATTVELSFWGGVDPETGMVIDQHHPLHGSCLTGRILAIPGSRGSCSGSGVMMEMLLNGKGPAALVLSRDDDILTLGVFVAEEVFCKTIPVVVLDEADFQMLVQSGTAFVCDGMVALDGNSLPDAAPQGQSSTPETSIQLSPVDQALLTGERGRAAQAAMKIILRMARQQGAASLFDVTQCHIDGCIYTGPGSLKFAEQMRDWGGKVAIPTTLNAISVDNRRWRAQGVDPAFGEAAERLGAAYVAMGARATFTCAPYLLDTAPKANEQIAWAESNAVAYANSVLGARTQKYPDYLDACIALTGRAPSSIGCHLNEGRRPEIRITVPPVFNLDDAFYPLLGYHVGKLAANRIPLVYGLENTQPSTDDLKAFSAAFATTSGAPMFHIMGVTPEASAHEHPDHLQTVTISHADLAETWEELNGALADKVELVSLGNPHFSLTEFEALAALCEGRTRHPDVAMIITCGRDIQVKAIRSGIVAELQRFGAEIVTDTCWCMITEPVIAVPVRTIMTNSGKYAHYGPGLTGRQFRFGSLVSCVEAAASGIVTDTKPAWLTA
jgi:cis-L-3-hydroxyproline dehydratase